MDDSKDLLEFLLGEGAKVERTGRPVFLGAEAYRASDEIKYLLVKHGANKDFNKEERV